MPFPALLLVLLPLAQGPLDARQAAEEILERGHYQRELPIRSDPGSAARDLTGSGPGSEPDPDRRSTLRPREEDAAGGRARRPESRGSSDAGSLALPAELVQAIGWVLLGVLVVAGIVWLVRARGGGDVRLRGEDDAAPETPIAPAFDAQPLEDAERLAREGRYAEAIRALLLQTFQALRGREGVRLEPWLTSREVLAVARLSDAHRASLGQLVDAVERSLFARRVPGRAEFEACAREYRALLSGGAADG